jgi:hypothetical protein
MEFLIKMTSPWCKYFEICSHKYIEGTEHLKNEDYLECPTFISPDSCEFYKKFENELEKIVDESKD